MKAINLIPADARRGQTAAGHSGGIVYVVLGTLAVLVVLTAAWAVMGKQIGDRRDEAAQLEAEATRLEARAASLKRYEAAAVASKQRIDTVKALADSRFEWAHSLREISRVLPKDTWLTSINGTTTPASGGTTAGAGTAPTGGPSVELVGCTRNQDSVARVMAQLRGMDGVTGVKLASSAKGSGGGNSSSGGCAAGSPQFKLSVAFRTKAAPAAAPGAAAPAPAGGAATPPANGTATPPASGAAAPAANGTATPPASGAAAPAPGTAPAGQTAPTSPTTGAAK